MRAFASRRETGAKFHWETKAIARCERRISNIFSTLRLAKGTGGIMRRGSRLAVRGGKTCFHVLQVQRQELTGHLCEEISMEMEVRLALLIRDASAPYRQFGGAEFNPLSPFKLRFEK